MGASEAANVTAIGAAAGREGDQPDRLAVLLTTYEAGRSDESSWGNLLLAVAAATLTYMAASLVFMSRLPGWAVLSLPAVAIAFLSYLIQLLEVAGVRREELEAIERELQGRAQGVTHSAIPGFMVDTRHIWVWDEADLLHKFLAGFAWLSVLATTVGYMTMIVAEAYSRSVHAFAIYGALSIYVPVLAMAAWIVVRFIASSGATAKN